VKTLKQFEKATVYALIGMMALTVFLATVEVAWLLVRDIFSPPLFILEIDELLEVFGMFLLVLIGLELIHTLKSYLSAEPVHLEVVLMLAIIAVARKVIVLDVKEASGMTLVGIAAIVLALSIGYYLVTCGVKQRMAACAAAREAGKPEDGE
jgi:uncharacterized membrane protein (DUF373 family)